MPSVSQRLELERRGFERLALMARGVDAGLFNPAKRSQALRENWGLDADDIAVLHVGRLAAEKNLTLLQPCLQALQNTHPQRRLRLVVVGDGPQRAALEQQMPDAVFCGAQRGEALAEHYASGDLFLFPSLTETFGNVVLEAMASAWPWSPTMRPPQPSTSAMATAARWPCLATRAHSSMPPAGCWKKTKPCAGSA